MLNFAFLLFVTIVIYSSFILDSNTVVAQSCKDSNILNFLEVSILPQLSRNVSRTALQNVISSVKQNTPVTVVGDIPICNNILFKDRSCCRKEDFVEIQKFINDRFLNLDMGFLTKKIVDYFLGNEKCLKVVSSTNTEELKKQLISDFEASISGFSSKMARMVRNSMRLSRGAVCAMCVDPAKSSNYISGKSAADFRLILRSEDYEAWVGECIETLEAANSFRYHVKNMTHIFLAKNLDSNMCNQEIDRMKSFIDSKYPNNLCGTECNRFCRANVNLLRDELMKQLALYTITGDKPEVKYFKSSYEKHILISSKGGFNAYQPAKDDELIKINGATPETDTLPYSSSKRIAALSLALCFIVSLILL